MPIPFVSVIIPTYNRAHLIGEAIQSVIDQTYPNWELIIVDDGSLDNTRNLVMSFVNSNIRYFIIDHCGILGKVRMEGLSHATGDYIAFLDSDDIWLPTKLEYQINLLHEHIKAAYIFGHGEQFGEGAIPPPELEKFFVGNVFLPVLIEERFVFYVPSLVFKKEVYNVLKEFDTSLISGSDIDFFLRMAYQFTGIFSNKIVVKIRKHKQNTSNRFEFTAYLDYLLMLEKFLKKNWLPKSQFKTIASRQFYRLSMLYHKRGFSKEATLALMKYLSIRPFHFKGWIRLFQVALGLARRL